MRAYLIASGNEPPDVFAAADALVFEPEAPIRPPSLQAAGDAIPSRLPGLADLAQDGFASRATTVRGGNTRLLLRVAGIDASDLDTGLAGTVPLKPDAIVLPARHGRDVAHLGSRLAVLEAEHGLPDGRIGIVAIVGCATGVLAVDTLVGSSPRLCGLGWDRQALARQLGMPGQSPHRGEIAYALLPDPEAPQRSGDFESSRSRLQTSFAAQRRSSVQDEGLRGGHPWGLHPVLAHARAVVRLAAAAAGVEAIEAAYADDDAAGFGAHVAAARRDGFAAMLAWNAAQVRLIHAQP